MITPKRLRLPTEPSARSLELVRRSVPDPKVPPTGLPPDLDEIVRKGERDRAMVYASMDDVIDRCDRLAEDIESSGVVIDVIDPAEDDSLVQSVDGLHEKQAAIASTFHH